MCRCIGATRASNDWESLRVQVRRWQNFSGLAWTDDEIDAVTRHLNTLYYKFPPAQRITQSLHDGIAIRL